MLLALFFWIAIILIIWSIICIIVKNRDTSSVNHAAQLESLFAPALHSEVSDHETNIQILGLEKWKSITMRWIVDIATGTKVHTIIQNRLRMETLFRMMNENSEIALFYSPGSISENDILSWSQTNTQVTCYSKDSNNIKSYLHDSNSVDITVFVNIDQSLFSLPSLLKGISESREWDLCMFDCKMVVPATFASLYVDAQWIKFVKNINNRDTWFPSEESKMNKWKSAMYWVQSNNNDFKHFVSTIDTSQSIEKQLYEYYYIDYDVRRYPSACLISSKTAYYQY